jgi:hypothetical protein
MTKAAAQPNPPKRKTPPSAGAPEQAAAPIFRPPLKPRPKLFVALLVVLGAWVGVLVTIYFVTVYPNRDRHLKPVSPLSTEPTMNHAVAR